MRAFLGWASRFLAIAMFVVGVLLIAWQVRSYWVRHFAQGGFGYITSESGRFVFVWKSWNPLPITMPAQREVRTPREYVDRELSRIGTTDGGDMYDGVRSDLGFAFGRAHPAYAPRMWIFVAPHSVPGVALIVLSLLIWFVPPWRTRRHRRKKGLCVKCGYDLRATTDRCPECGQAVAP